MPFAGLFAPENFRLVKNMIRRKRWLSVLCAIAVMLTSAGGWWSEYSVGSAAVYWAYVEDYYQGSVYTSSTLSFSNNNPVTIETFYGQRGTDKTPGKIHSGMVLSSYSSGSVTPLENGAGRAVLSRYFAQANCTVTYTDKVSKGPRQGDTLGSTNKTVPCGQSISGNDISDSYTGFVYTSATTDDTYKYTASIERKFEPVTTTVYYNYQGGTGGSVNSEEFYYGSAIQLKKNTSVKNYTIKLHSAAGQGSAVAKTIQASSTFRGWAEQAGGNILYSDGASIGTVSGSQNSTKSLFAIWADETVTPPAPEERKGYKFLGWSTEADAKTGTDSFTVTADMELYPVWSAQEKSWKAQYYRENLDGEYELADEVENKGLVDNAASLDAPQDKYQGFSLNTSKSNLTGTIPAEGDFILKAYYSRNSYSISYDANGGEKTGNEAWSAENKFGGTVKLISPNVKRTGYRFNGWSETPEGGETPLAPGSDFTVPAQDITLYANWVPISYEVSFEGNGAVNAAESMGNVQAEYDKEITLPECTYIKPGYGFAGWNTKADGSGLMYSAGARVRNLLTSEGTVKLYAQWKVRTYSVSYNTNHTERMLVSNANSIPDTEYKYGDEVTARDSVYKALGYQMTGWNTKADGTGISVALGEKISDKIECNTDIVLYAVWDRNRDTAFEITLCTMSADNTENQVETLTLSGVTEEKICDAVKRIYEEELDGEPLSFFYEGYEVVNMEEMEKTIAGDGGTAIKLQLKERRCQLFFKYFADGQEVQLEKVDLAYMEPCVLPDKIGEQAGIAKYTTAKQESYSPGEEIRLRRNKTLYLQQAIRLEGNSGQFEDRTEYVVRGKNFALPEITKNGYQFLGWYVQGREYIGMPGQVMQRVMVNHTLTARWSDPLHYEIRFDIDEDKIRILENKVLEYQYGTAVELPTKEQVAVLVDGYTFLGWYEDGDENKTLITSIAAGSFGDKRLKALLVKDTAGGNGSGGGNGNDQNGGNGSGGNGSAGTNGNNGNGSGGDTGNGGQSGGSGSGGNGSGGSSGSGGQNGGSGSDGNAGNGGSGSDGSGGNGSGGSSGNGGQNGADGSNGNGTGGSAGNGGQNGADGSNGNGTNGNGGQNGANGTDGSNGNGSQNGAGGSNGNGTNGSDGNNGQNGANGTNGSSGNSGQNGANGTNGSNGNDGQNGTNGGNGNGQGSGLEEKPNSGSNLDSMKQHGIQGANIKLEKFWKNKLKYQMRRGKKGKILLKVINCRKSLKKVKVPASVRWKGKKYKVTRIGKKAFYKKGKVRSVIVGKNVKRIGRLSLAKMKRLRRVTLGKTVRTIKAKAFVKDPSLQKLVIRTKKLKRVAKNAFRQTKPKKGIKYPKGKKRAYRAYFPA